MAIPRADFKGFESHHLRDLKRSEFSQGAENTGLFVYTKDLCDEEMLNPSARVEKRRDMDIHLEKRNEKLAETVIKGLKSRNMSGYYARNKEEALKLALDLIPKNSSISMGGCMSAREIGLVSALEQGEFNFIDRSKLEPREALLAAYDADIFLASANAMTDDGILVNIDGNANRVSCIAQGPRKVLFIVSMNKVCPDLDSAMKRARNVAAPANTQRFDIKTPCKLTGKCSDCKSPDTICCQFLITRYSRHTDRIHVILVNENLGL